METNKANINVSDDDRKRIGRQGSSLHRDQNRDQDNKIKENETIEETKDMNQENSLTNNDNEL